MFSCRMTLRCQNYFAIAVATAIFLPNGVVEGRKTFSAFIPSSSSLPLLPPAAHQKFSLVKNSRIFCREPQKSTAARFYSKRTELAMSKILHVISSARPESNSTKLGQMLISRFPGATVTVRDLGKNPPSIVNEQFVDAWSIPSDQHTEQQRRAFSESDALLAELKAHDIVVLSVAVYNFNIPASLKAWFDQIVCPGRAYVSTPAGAVGLLQGKKAYVVSSSGVTPFGSPMDHYSRYLVGMLGFVGIRDVTLAASVTVARDKDESWAAAERAIAALPV